MRESSPYALVGTTERVGEVVERTICGRARPPHAAPMDARRRAGVPELAAAAWPPGRLAACERAREPASRPANQPARAAGAIQPSRSNNGGGGEVCVEFCMCVCIRVCACARVCVEFCVCVYMYDCVRVRVFVCGSVCECVLVVVGQAARAFPQSSHTRAYVRSHTRARTRTYATRRPPP